MIRNAQIAGRLTDLTFDTLVREAAPGCCHGEGLDAQGCAVLPGLHDHHLHFMAAARAATSVDLSSIPSGDAAALGEQLVGAPGSDWIRAVGYHERIAGDLDAVALDRLVGERPVRLQHSSGKLWLLNTAALTRLGLTGPAAPGPDRPAGVELNAAGAPTGRLFRLDDWLREQLGASDPVDVASYSHHLASLGIVSFTDTSYTNDVDTERFFHSRAQAGELLQWVHMMGDESLGAGHLKIILDEDELPDIDDLNRRIEAAHAARRPVAFHCLTRLELLLALMAIEKVGLLPGDRIEHAALVPDDLLPMLARSGLRIVTQPGFLADRGERFRRDLPSEEGALYRYRSLLDAGIQAAASSDAPYGPVDPWLVMHAAVHRITDGGRVLGERERVEPVEALRGYLAHADDPGGPARQIRPGAPADLIVLDRTLEQALEDLSAVRVRATFINGRLVYDNADNT